jgi:transposase
MVILQNIGIDGGMEDFKVCLMTLEQDQALKVKGSRTFANSVKGFEAFRNWVEKKQIPGIALRFTMEATGVYYESLAYFLHQHHYYVSVILPNKSKAYMQSLNLKSKTDKLEARALAQLGLERRLSKWEPLSQQMYQLKRHSRERVMLLEEKNMIFNRLHAEQHCQQPNVQVIRRMRQRIQLIENQIQQVEQQLHQLVEKDAQLDQRVKKICSLKGLGFITIISVIAETNGFALFTNRAQLASYAGYDVVERESGSSVKGKTRISKKGNRYIRRALHLPSLSVIRHNEEFKKIYERIYERTKIKMKGIIAVQRKLLLLIYTLFNSNQAYDPNYSFGKVQNKSRQDTKPAYAG